MPKRVISVRFDEKLEKALDAAAEAIPVSRSALIEGVLRRFLDQDPATQKRLLHPRAFRFRDKDPQPADPGAPICYR